MVADRQTLEGFLQELLAEQERLQTPVTRAAAAHVQARSEAPAAKTFHDLIPLTAPGPGEQYAFEVDLDSCSGCKACVVACHALNGLEDTESWRDVGLIHGGSAAAPFQQTITTACHHCADPACLNGCPVLAYEKDPVTGIVRHLDDQCIGCQYCILKCPYDVPKFSERLGIVRKCDLCHQRLGAGEAPACAQACPTAAIRVVKVSVTSGSTPRADTATFLAAAPDPAYTQPTTRYVIRRPYPANAVAADAGALRPQPPHWPLVVMLTLVPFAIGLQTALLTPLGRAAAAWWRWAPLALGATGLGAASFHLGQPLRAWRVFLGLRKSWFSREAVMFGAWMGATGAATLLPVLGPLAAGAGMVGLACSVMIYVDTRRVFWRAGQTAPRLLGTALVLALATLAPVFGAFALAGKLGFETWSLRGPGTSARIMRGPLRSPTTLRFVCGLAACAGLAFGRGGLPAAFSLAAAVTGELAERYLFFRAVDAPKMPGSIRG